MFKSTRSIGSNRRAALGLESLEDRSLLSVGITEFPVPAPLGVDDIGYNGKGITAGADGNIWFHLENEGEIGRITPDGQVTDFSVPSPLASVGPMTEGPDGNIWFIGYTPVNDVFLCSMTPTGAVTEFSMWHDVPTTINSMTVGPDGNFWFAGWWEGAVIGRVTPTGQVTVFDTPQHLCPVRSLPGRTAICGSRK
jgi:streptogramin lyase